MAIGDLIQWTNLFNLRTNLDRVLNRNTAMDDNPLTFTGGYNQAHTIAASPATGDLIDDAYLDSIYSAAAKLANYYNITNPFTAVNAGDTILWSNYAEHATTFSNDILTLHDSPWTYSAGWDTTTATELTSSVSNWNGAKTFDFYAQFNDTAHMNSWFSAGGEVRIALNHSTTSSDLQAQSWVQLCNEVGTFTVSARPTDTTVTGNSVRKRYSDLTASYSEIKIEYADLVYYVANYIQIQAYKTATTVYFRVKLNDAHTSSSGSWTNDGGGTWTGSDVVTGTTTCTVQSLKLSNVAGSVNITNPSWVTTSNF